MNRYPSKIIIFITVVLMDVLTSMEFNLFLPSFPEIQNQFNLTTFWTETLLTFNCAGYCLGLVFAGSLADNYGRKPIIILGIIIFIAGSVCCLIAKDFYLLLIGRFTQGLGISSPSILSFLVIVDIYHYKEQQSIGAALNGILNIFSGLAPVIGSYISLYFNWQGNAATLLIMGLATLVMTIVFIPKHKKTGDDIIEKQNKIPIFKMKSLRLLITHITLISTPYWVFAGISPILYVESIGVSVNEYGYYLGLLCVVYAIGILIYSRFINKYDQRKMLHIAYNLYILSLVLIVAVSIFANLNPYLITLALLILVIGQIIPGALFYPLCLNLKPESKGKIAAILKMARLALSGTALQITSYYYSGSFLSVGIILAFFILTGVITMRYVFKDQIIMSFVDK